MNTDSNTAALSQYETEQDKRQRSYDALEPKAKALLREWVRDGETIGKPKSFDKLSPFLLADRITDDAYGSGFDEELVCNLITAAPSMLSDWCAETLKRVGDNAYDMWLTTPEASSALEDVISYLEQCELEDNDES